MPELLRCSRLLPRAASAPIADAGVLVDAGRVVEAGPWAVMVRHAESLPVVDLPGVTLPGLIDAHNHLRGTPLELQGVPDAPLELWLLRLRTLSELSWADEARVAAGQLLGTGVTTVQGVLHGAAARAAYMEQIEGVVAVLAESGIRADVMVGLTDQAEYAPPGLLEDDLAAYVRADSGTGPADLPEVIRILARRWEGDRTGSRVRVGVAPVAPQWSSDELLGTAGRLLAEGVRAHTHLLESPAQRRWLPEDPVGRLRRAGLLGPGLSVAHGVWLEDAELAELADAEVGVVHCPTSNAGLEVGAARVRAWWDAGLVPALATDSHPRNGRLDIFAEMRCALTTAEGVGAPLSPTEVLSMATIGGAAAVGRGDDLGEIAVGYAADMVTLDLPTGHVTGADVLAEAVVEAGPNRVAQVHVAGRRVVHDGQLMAADETSAAEHRLLLQLRADADARRRRQEAATVLDARVLNALHRAGVPVGVGVRS